MRVVRVREREVPRVDLGQPVVAESMRIKQRGERVLDPRVPEVSRAIAHAVSRSLVS